MISFIVIGIWQDNYEHLGSSQSGMFPDYIWKHAIVRSLQMRQKQAVHLCIWRNMI